MSQTTVSEDRETICLAKFVAGTGYDDLGEEVLNAVETSLVDTLAASYAGTRTAVGATMLGYVDHLAGGGNATVLGGGSTLQHFAALANGTTGHALDVDDGHRTASAHPGSVVVPAALATAETEGASGEDFATAVAVGYEAMIPTAASIQPSHRERGFHATATTGCFGAAAAVASLLDLDVASTADALGLAGTQAGGLFEFLATGSGVKRFHPGRAALAGVLAGELAAEGFDGPDTIIEGADGFARAFADEYDPSPFDSLGDPFEITRVYRKPYPCCRHIHGPIDAVKAIRESGISAEDVARIRVETYQSASYHDETDIETLVDAQMSIPYGVAVTFLTGEARLPQFDPPRTEERVRSLIDRIEVVQTDEMEAKYPDTRPASVIVETADGVHERLIEYPLGSPEDPLSDETLRTKFHDLAVDALDVGGREAVLDAAFDIAAVDDVAEFARLL